MAFVEKIKKYALLKLYVDETNTELVELYKKHINKHNVSIKSNTYPNSGFDLFIPNDRIFDIPWHSYMVNLKVKAEMFYDDGSNLEPCAYYIYPRSSMAKTPLMLANHSGIIDSGYRGWLIAALRWLNEISTYITNDSAEYILEKYTRLLQICHPTLCPILVEIISLDELSVTERGEGSFGSTGQLGL